MAALIYNRGAKYHNLRDFRKTPQGNWRTVSTMPLLSGCCTLPPGISANKMGCAVRLLLLHLAFSEAVVD